MIGTGRISLHNYVMHGYEHLTETVKIANWKISFVTLIMVPYYF